MYEGKHEYAPGIAEALERSDWTPEEALRWYAEGNHFDTFDNHTRIVDTGGVASNALKNASPEYLEMKGNAELFELRSQFVYLQSAEKERNRLREELAALQKERDRIMERKQDAIRKHDALVLQNRSLVAELAALKAGHGEPVMWVNPNVIGADQKINWPTAITFSNRGPLHGWTFPLYAAPFALGETTLGLLERALKADPSIGANAIQLADGWKAMGELRALLASRQDKPVDRRAHAKHCLMLDPEEPECHCTCRPVSD